MRRPPARGKPRPVLRRCRSSNSRSAAARPLFSTTWWPRRRRRCSSSPTRIPASSPEQSRNCCEPSPRPASAPHAAGWCSMRRGAFRQRPSRRTGTARRGSRRPRARSVRASAPTVEFTPRAGPWSAPLPTDTTSMDDFLIPVRPARSGARVVFADGAVAREDAAKDVEAEAARRLRIGIGAGQVLRRELWLWNAAAHPALTLAFASRKAARWLAPVAALAAAAAALFVPELAPARRRGARPGGPSPALGAGPAGPAGNGREALLFRRVERGSRARRRGGSLRLQPSFLGADGAFLMAARRPSAFRAVALFGDVAIAVGALDAAFLLRTHVSIPGHPEPAAGRQRPLHVGKHPLRRRGPGLRALVLRALSRSRAFPGAPRASASAGAVRRAPDPGVGLLPRPAVLVSALGADRLHRHQRRRCSRCGGPRSTGCFRSRAVGR